MNRSQLIIFRRIELHLGKQAVDSFRSFEEALVTEDQEYDVIALPEQRRLLFFTLNREDFSFVIHLDRQPRTSRRREAQTGSRARSGSRSERTLDASSTPVPSWSGGRS